MKYKYEYTLNDLKKYLISTRKTNNIVLYIIGIGLFLILTYKRFNYIHLLFFAILFLVLLVLLNRFYVFLYLKVNNALNNNVCGKYEITLNSKYILVSCNRRDTKYEYNKMKKIIIKKNYFKIKLNKIREYLTFEKKLFNEKDYNELINELKKRIN